MKAMFVSLVLIALFAVIGTSTAAAQPFALRGSSLIELNLGLWSHFSAGSQITGSGIMQEAKSGGFMGGVTYAYWMREHLAVTVSGGLLSAQATNSVSPAMILSTSIGQTVEQNTNSVVSLLLGVRYYVPSPEPEDAVRPYVAAGVGSYMGFEASNSLFVQSSHSESSFGGRVGVGVDMFLGEIVKLDAAVGYNLMADFTNTVGGRTNFNGADASIGIGFLF